MICLKGRLSSFCKSQGSLIMDRAECSEAAMQMTTPRRHATKKTRYSKIVETAGARDDMIS